MITDIGYGTLIVESEPTEGTKFSIYCKAEPDPVVVTTLLN